MDNTHPIMGVMPTPYIFIMNSSESIEKLQSIEKVAKVLLRVV